MRWVAAALALALALDPAAAQAEAGDPDSRVGGALAQGLLSADADRFDIWQFRAGAIVGPSSPSLTRAVALQTTRYEQHGWHKQATGIVGVWRDLSPDGTGINAEAGVVQVGPYTRPVADASWSMRPIPSTGVELIAAAGLVDTQKAIEDGTAYSFLGAAVEHAFAPRLTAIVLVATQPFTDGNNRLHARIRLVYDLLPEAGINLQARWKQYRSGQEDVDGAYFNPRRYRQWLAGTGFRRRMAGWTISGTAMGGQEESSGSTRQPSWLGDLRAEGAIAPNAYLAFSATYTRAAGFSNDPDYWYTLLAATLRVSF